MSKLYRIKEICSISNIGESTLRKLIKRHQLDHYRLGGNDQIAMTKDQIDDLIMSNARLITKR